MERWTPFPRCWCEFDMDVLVTTSRFLQLEWSCVSCALGSSLSPLFLKTGWQGFDHSNRTSSFVVCCHGETSLSGRKWQEGLKVMNFSPFCASSLGGAPCCSVGALCSVNIVWWIEQEVVKCQGHHGEELRSSRESFWPHGEFLHLR